MGKNRLVKKKLGKKKKEVLQNPISNSKKIKPKVEIKPIDINNDYIMKENVEIDQNDMDLFKQLEGEFSSKK